MCVGSTLRTGFSTAILQVYHSTTSPQNQFHTYSTRCAAVAELTVVELVPECDMEFPQAFHNCSSDWVPQTVCSHFQRLSIDHPGITVHKIMSAADISLMQVYVMLGLIWFDVHSRWPLVLGPAEVVGYLSLLHLHCAKANAVVQLTQAAGVCSQSMALWLINSLFLSL